MDQAEACKSLQAALRPSRRTNGCANSGDEGGRMSLFRRGDVWWYEFWFAGRRIQESSKSPSKTIARTAEQNRRRELEEGFNNFTDIRRERVRIFSDVADEFFNGYRLRLPNSAVFADYAIHHLKRLLGSRMLVDFNEAAVIKYQNDRLDEGTAARSPQGTFPAYLPRVDAGTERRDARCRD